MNKHGTSTVLAQTDSGYSGNWWSFVGLAEVVDIAGIADILQTYCRHIADILRTYCGYIVDILQIAVD